jgi:amino acid transporter
VLNSANTASESRAAVRLKPCLSRKDLIVYGLAILTPTAAYPVFGVIQQASNGHAALSYVAAMAAMLFTAISYGRMATAFPVAGSTYSYSSQGLHPIAGFLAGWGMMLDYVLVPLLSTIFVSLTAERLLPQVPYVAWALLFSLSITLTNVRGMEATKRMNEIMLLVMIAAALWFALAAILHVAGVSGVAGLWNSRGILRPEAYSTSAVMFGASIATLSYLGFDAVSTMAEDARDPRRDIGYATVLVCILQTGICVAIAYLAVLVWPAEKAFGNVETAILDISRVAGGAALFGFTSFVLLVAGVASSLASQAGASRLLYGMGRDGVLPRAVFAHLDPVHSTPVRSIWLMGILSFVGALFISFQQIVELVNFGAFAGFVLVNLSVAGHYYFRKRERAGMQMVTNLICPLLGAIVCAAIWFSLSRDAKITGFAWLAIGICYLAWLTRGFSRSIKSAVPSMEMQ